MESTAKEYTESFGFQWNRFKKTQFDSYTGVPITKNRLQRLLGDLWHKLKDSEVLECACGAGRFTEILVQESKYVFAVDSSSAALVNAENINENNYKVLQADVLKLDHCIEKFDFVFGLGFIQHTPSSEETIRKIYRYVKPGGYLIFDHYTFLRSYISMRLIYRQFFRRLNPQKAYNILFFLSSFFLPMHKKIKNFKLLSILLNRFSPFITYYKVYPSLSDELQIEWALLDTFDSLTDHHKNFKSKTQILSILSNLNVEVIRCEYGGNGVEVICRKPA